jgi:hypothetical protein
MSAYQLLRRVAFTRRHLIALGCGVLALAFIAWYSLRTPGAGLYIHNHTERPIFSYFVNDNWGGNGGVTCCWRIEGRSLKVDWIKSITRTQHNQGMREETLSLEIENPPRKRDDNTLHVHFLPEDKVRLAWSNGHISPLKEELAPYYAKDQVAKTAPAASIQTHARTLP